MSQLAGNAKAPGKGKNGTPRKHHTKNVRFRGLFSVPGTFRNFQLPPYTYPIVLGVILSFVLSLLVTSGLSVTSIDYQIGDIARRDIKAPRRMRIEDTAATEILRQSARDQVLPHYDIDSKLFERTERQIRSAFESIQKSLMTHSSKIRSRLLSLQGDKKRASLVSESLVYKDLYRLSEFNAEESTFGRMLGGKISPNLFVLFRNERYATWLGEDLTKLVRSVLAKGVVSDIRLYEIHLAKGIILRDIRTGERVRLPIISKPLELREVKEFLFQEAEKLKLHLPPAQRVLLAAQAAKLIQPTLNFNNQATALAQVIAAKEVKPASQVLKDGEMIVREGERISQSQMTTLSALERAGRQSHIVDNFIGTTILVALFLMFAWTAAERYDLGILERSKDVFLFVLLLATQTILIKLSIVLAHEFQGTSRGLDVSVYYLVIPLASASMLASILQGRSTAILMAIMSSVMAGLLFPGNVHFTLITLAGGVYAAINWKDYRHRTSILIVGLMVGIANAVLILGFNLQGGLRLAIERWADMPFAFAGGIANIIVVSAVMPLLESAFKMTTDMKLLELSDQNHPLLRQLVVRAPGTYHHSLLVGNLAEEAADAVQANPLLIRVGAYFHDIGKVVKPEYFIENQGPLNRHDKLSPSMSALILVSHVKEGLEMAKSHKLPKEICDLICQHHGTSLIRFFFERAKEQGGENVEIHEEIYRYPGPKPQTREAGIMMLADMVEAASRSLTDTSPARLAGLVERLVQTAFSDGQLDECDLTLRHLSLIQQAFLRVLAGIYHHRVIYPEKTGQERKGANGDIHNKPSKESAPQHRTIAQAGGGDS